MLNLLKIIGRIGLLVTILPAVLFLFGWMTLASAKLGMILGTVIWLVTAPVVQKMNKESV
jgi:Na+/proline symporter